MPTVRTLTAEFIGTFGLVFACAASVVIDQSRGGALGLVGIGIAQAAVLAAMVIAFRRISGAHFNPAITAGFWIAGRMDIRTGGAYVVTQMLAAIGAAYVVASLLPSGAGEITGYGVPRVGAGTNFLPAIGIEALFAFLLAGAYLGTVSAADAPVSTGLAAGLVTAAAVPIAGPLSGAALNPARAFGPALASMEWNGHAAFWIGPILGTLLAGVVWRTILAAPDSD